METADVGLMSQGHIQARKRSAFREKMDKAGLSRLKMRYFFVGLGLAVWWLVVILFFSFESRGLGLGSWNPHSSQNDKAKLSKSVWHTREPLDVAAAERDTYQMEGEGGGRKRGEGVVDGGLSGRRFATRVGVKAVTASKEDGPTIKLGDPCKDRYIYVHGIPREFNEQILEECQTLSPWTNMCKYLANAGLGPAMEDVDHVFSERGWFATNQFAVEVIFHNRMKQYKCLTNDSSQAAAFFVPFYAGLEISPNLWGGNVSVRDAAPSKLVNWLQSQSPWATLGGRDHFMVGGRITWDFRRETDEERSWGNKLLVLPAVLNMTVLVIESSPWHTNDFGIPYPTYFHPTSDSEIQGWQDRTRKMVRTALFSFAGAPRPEISTSIRGHIMDQCGSSQHCRLLECDKGESACHSPAVVMKLFEESVFCLQPQGDSFTRRSIFDSMLAGCIPVFFHVDSAYSQYIWHLPSNYSQYSVFIPEDDIRSRNASIEDVLLGIPLKEIERMREAVVQLIPGLVYADPRASPLDTARDAFDIAVQGVIDKVADLKVRIRDGRDGEKDSLADTAGNGVGKRLIVDRQEASGRSWQGTWWKSKLNKE